ncbi:MAG: hypothetical protein FWF51_10450 [Chitinivibrionia bacterium]|nr:hypothetical protein [Chitinivibrionia bacterium]
MRNNIDDYMNDPDIINEPSALREIHAIRLRIRDETKNLTTQERTTYFREGAESFFARKEAVKK